MFAHMLLAAGRSACAAKAAEDVVARRTAGALGDPAAETVLRWRSGWADYLISWRAPYKDTRP